MFSNLHPGTTYLISVRARTAKGFGQPALTEITTNISGICVTDYLKNELWKLLLNCEAAMETDNLSVPPLM